MYQYLVIHGIRVQHLADRLNEYAKEAWRVKALIEGPNELPLALLEREAPEGNQPRRMPKELRKMTRQDKDKLLKGDV
jgi:hypothetical protein